MSRRSAPSITHDSTGTNRNANKGREPSAFRPPHSQPQPALPRMAAPTSPSRITYANARVISTPINGYGVARHTQYNSARYPTSRIANHPARPFANPPARPWNRHTHHNHIQPPPYNDYYPSVRDADPILRNVGGGSNNFGNEPYVDSAPRFQRLNDVSQSVQPTTTTTLNYGTTNITANALDAGRANHPNTRESDSSGQINEQSNPNPNGLRPFPPPPSRTNNQTTNNAIPRRNFTAPHSGISPNPAPPHPGTVANVVNEQLNQFQVGKKFYSQDEIDKMVKFQLCQAVGIDKITMLHSHKNKDKATNATFTHQRWDYVCGSCKPDERKVSITKEGCCGLCITMKLVTNNPHDVPHYIVQKFQLPVTSKHAMIAQKVREKNEKPMWSESQLSHEQETILKVLGKLHVNSYLARGIMREVFPDATIGRDLLNRVRKKGLEEAYGDGDSSMALAVEHGNKWRSEGGKYQVQMCGNSLHSWSGQTLLEKQLYGEYGIDLLFLDTTYNACQWDLKTGLVKTVDSLGLTTPVGSFQVPEEDGQSVHERMYHLEFNNSKTHTKTDAGGAWEYPIETVRQQVRTEDPHHLDRRAMEICGRLSSEGLATKFTDDVGTALYHLFPSDKALDDHLARLVEYTKGTGVEKYVQKLVEKKRIRCFHHTSQYFCCAEKGGGSRAEQAYNILKAGGTIKQDMRKWTIKELMEKIDGDIDHYKNRSLDILEKHILEQKGFLSDYIKKQEKAESEKMSQKKLTILSQEENVADPFYKKHPKPSFDMRGIIDNEEQSDCDDMGVVGAVVAGVEEEEDEEPLLGTKYKIARADGKYDPVTVFIPNDPTCHATSDFFKHQTFWCRDRFIQLALLHHPSRGMDQMGTIHKRWDIRRHPLYKEKYNSLKEMMKIDGLNIEYLPAGLAPVDGNRDLCPLPEGQVADTHPGTVVLPKPNMRQIARYKDIKELTGKLETYAKSSVEMHKMIHSNLQAVIDNCVVMQKKSSKAAEAAKKMSEKHTAVPRAPDKVINQNDDVMLNRSNWNQNKPARRKGGAQQKRGSTGISGGGGAKAATATKPKQKQRRGTKAGEETGGGVGTNPSGVTVQDQRMTNAATSYGGGGITNTIGGGLTNGMGFSTDPLSLGGAGTGFTGYNAFGANMIANQMFMQQAAAAGMPALNNMAGGAGLIGGNPGSNSTIQILMQQAAAAGMPALNNMAGGAGLIGGNPGSNSMAMQDVGEGVTQHEGTHASEIDENDSA